MKGEYELCFGCGKKNPWGLKLEFYEDGEWYSADFTPHEFYQGFPGVVHGGILVTAMDEAMAKVLFHHGIPAFTVKLEVRLLDKAVPGEKLKVSSKIVENKNKIFILEAKITDEDKKKKATAKGVFQRIREEVLKELLDKDLIF